MSEKVDKYIRYKQIKDILKGRELTAKEVAVAMCKRGFTPTDERNFSAPRITELYNKGEVVIVSHKKCQYTGKAVYIYALAEDVADDN